MRPSGDNTSLPHRPSILELRGRWRDKDHPRDTDRHRQQIERAVVNDLWRSDLTTSDNPLRCTSTGITRLSVRGSTASL
jgi:hypothetical protein